MKAIVCDIKFQSFPILSEMFEENDNFENPWLIEIKKIKNKVKEKFNTEINISSKGFIKLIVWYNYPATKENDNISLISYNGKKLPSCNNLTPFSILDCFSLELKNDIKFSNEYWSDNTYDTFSFCVDELSNFRYEEISEDYFL
jgi:hypothetical protein